MKFPWIFSNDESELKNKLDELKEIWKIIEDNYLEKLKKDRKEKLREKINGLAYSNEFKVSINLLLKTQKSIADAEWNNKSSDYLLTLKEEILEELSQLVKKEELEKLCQMQEEITSLELAGKTELDFAKKIEFTKWILSSSVECRNEVENLEKQIDLLLKQVKKGEKEEQFQEVMFKESYFLNKLNKMEELVSQNNNWQNIHTSFTLELQNHWQNLNFTYQQTQEWINIGLTPQDHQFAHFLKNIKQLTPEEILNHHNLENLKQEFQTYQQNNQQPQIIQTNPPNLNK